MISRANSDFTWVNPVIPYSSKDKKNCGVINPLLVTKVSVCDVLLLSLLMKVFTKL